MKEKYESKAQKLMEKLIKNSTLKKTSPLNDSDVLKEIPAVPMRVPLMNLALNGKISGGLERGLIMLCGESKSFKTSFGLEMVASYLEQKPNAVCLFFDGEFGAKKSYFESFGVDTNRVIHIPFQDIEELKFEMVKQLTDIELGDDVICFLDSLGNVPSKAELDNSLEQKSVPDLQRAKALKSLFRMITPKLYMKNIPCVVVNHTYSTLSFYSVPVPSGGMGSIYSSSTIWMIGKNKLKEKDELTGYKFIIKIYKSRDIKDNSVFPITVRWEGGIAKWSGFDELALQLGIIEKCREGRSSAYQYTKLDGTIVKVLESKIDSSDDFWNLILKETDLEYRLESLYQIGKKALDTLNFDTKDVDTISNKVVPIKMDEKDED